MSRLLDDEQELQQRDRELTLSTGAILAIFLGLVLLCAVFFGFGYNVGRKSNSIAAVNIPNSQDNAAPADTTNFDNFKSAPANSEEKPAAGTGESRPAPQPAKPALNSEAEPSSTTTAHPAKTPATTTHPQPATAAPAHTAAHAAADQSAAAEHTPATPEPAVTPGGAFIVQIAAISHKEDADLLVTALHAKGYDVAARPSPQDKLLHIQVGPFASRKDAEAMRERLIMDGYNAIVK